MPDVIIDIVGRLPSGNLVWWWLRRHWTHDGRALARRLEACRP